MVTESSQTPSKTKKAKGKMSQERVMVMFTLYFMVGILLLVLMPEGHPVRGVALGLYSVAVFWSMFRFGI